MADGERTVLSARTNLSVMTKVILLAEDSADDAAMFKRKLCEAGVTNPLHVVSDGRSVINYLNGDGLYADRQAYPFPRVLFLDLMLPGMDGWQVLKWLNARLDMLERLAVFVLTGVYEIDRLQEAYRLGASSFLIKPLNVADLKQIFRHWPSLWELEKSATVIPPNDPVRPRVFPAG